MYKSLHSEIPNETNRDSPKEIYFQYLSSGKVLFYRAHGSEHFFWIPVGTKQGSARRSVGGLTLLSMPPRVTSTKLVMLLQNTVEKK